MNKFFKKVPTVLFALILTVSTFSAYYTPSVSAEGNVHIRISGSDRTIWYGDVQNTGCTVTDTAGVSHTFNQPVALCALDAAAKAGNFSLTLKDFGGSLGLFLDGIAEYKTAADFSTYWVYDLNGTPAQAGVATQLTSNGDSLFFKFEDPSANPDLRATNDGISYLRSQQNADGKINGFPGITAWAVMTFEAKGIDAASVSKGGASLLDYLKNNPPAADAGATEWERDILAVTSMGENPYDFGGLNYVQKLEGLHNNSQLGNPNAVNDDIFGILALVSAGPGVSGQIFNDSLNFVLAAQSQEGGFGWSINESSDLDTTAAALQALIASKKTGSENSSLDAAIEKAQAYLLAGQNSDGGFPYSKGGDSNSSTTAWVLMALNATGTGGETAAKARQYLRSMQEENGAFKWQTVSSGESFTTSYAVLALTGKYWPVGSYTNGQPSPIPSASVEPSPSPVISPSPSVSPSAAPSQTPAPDGEVVPSVTPSPSPSVSPREQRRITLTTRILERQRKMLEKLEKRIQRQLDRISKILARKDR